MRKNKKLLLASVAALGALAIGVGATSTFAWYQSASASKTTATDTVGTISTKATEYGIGQVLFTPYFKACTDASLNNNDDVTEITNIELTNSTGNKGVVTPSGNVQTPGEADASCYTMVGVSVVATKNSGSGELTDILKDLYDSGTHSITLTVTPAGNVVLKKGTAYNDNLSTVTAAGGFTANLATAQTWTLDLASDGSTKVWEANYMSVAVRTNNDAGVEALVDKTEEASYGVGGAYAVGDVIKESTTYYVCKKAIASPTTRSGDSASWETLAGAPTFHSANSLEATIA